MKGQYDNSRVEILSHLFESICRHGRMNNLMIYRMNYVGLSVNIFFHEYEPKSRIIIYSMGINV